MTLQPSHIKLALFYSSTVIGVVCLFGAVTSYGETSLQGATFIEGAYQLEGVNISEMHWGCFDDPAGQPTASQIWLGLQQSGVFLNASLVVVPEGSQSQDEVATEVMKYPTTLIGQWHGETLNLRGKLPDVKSCRGSASTQPIPLQGTLKANWQQNQLVGTLMIDGQPKPFEVQGYRVTPSKAESSSQGKGH